MSSKADHQRLGGIDGGDFISVVTPGVMSSFQIFTRTGKARFDLKPEELAELRTLVDRHLVAHAHELPKANGKHEIATLPDTVPESGFPVNGRLPEWLVPASIIAPQEGKRMRLFVNMEPEGVQIVSLPLRYLGDAPMLSFLTDRDGNAVTLLVCAIETPNGKDNL